MQCVNFGDHLYIHGMPFAPFGASSSEDFHPSLGYHVPKLNSCRETRGDAMSMSLVRNYIVGDSQRLGSEVRG